MNAADLPITKQVPTDTANLTRLSGRWLWAARAAWALTAVLVVILIVVGRPLRVADLSAVCLPEECLPLHISALGAQALEAALGITPLGYGLMAAGLETYITLVFLICGAIIAWRKSDDWMALYTSGVLILASVGLFGSLDTLAVQRPEFGPTIKLVRAAVYPLFIQLFYLFPDGCFAPGWARWPSIVVTVATVIVAFNFELFSAPGLMFLAAAMAGGVLSQIYRYRNVSTPSERQQTKWVIVGFGAMFFSIAIPGITLALLNIDTSRFIVNSVSDFILVVPLTAVTAFLPISLLPVTIAISTLRFRLWNVDPLINRSLVYGALTVLLGAVFAGGFFGIRMLLGSLLGAGQDWVAAGVSGAVIVASFNPARRWLRHFVDQRLYGIKIDYTPARKAPPQSVAAPRSTLGTYEGLELIGRGGMAEVYKATHPTLGRPVAIKVLPHSLAQDPDFRKRFEREARTVAALKHPNIVQLFDFGEADGTAYMVIEYIGGPDVGDVVKQGGLPIDRALSITREVASALDYAHQQGLVHRDIKPSNVMLETITASGKNDRNERTVLMDFGIARILSGHTRLTASGMIGTLDYMSPEQIKDAKDVDGRADIYSLGIMLFQMLTGRLPFTASNPGALLIAHLNQPAPDPRTIRADIPEDASLAALKAMEKDPDDRFQTAGEFAAVLA